MELLSTTTKKKKKLSKECWELARSQRASSSKIENRLSTVSLFLIYQWISLAASKLHYFSWLRALYSAFAILSGCANLQFQNQVHWKFPRTSLWKTSLHQSLDQSTNTTMYCVIISVKTTYFSLFFMKHPIFYLQISGLINSLCKMFLFITFLLLLKACRHVQP